MPQQQSHHVPRFKTLILCPWFLHKHHQSCGLTTRVYRHSRSFKYIQAVLLSQNIGKYTEGSLRLYSMFQVAVVGFQFLLTEWMFTSYFGVKKQRATVLTNTQLQRFVLRSDQSCGHHRIHKSTQNLVESVFYPILEPSALARLCF